MSPILQVYGGPNGSGKSSVINRMSPVGPVVNADEIQKILGCSALEAAQNAEKTREMLLASHESFAFESVLSTERNFTLIQRAKNAGYYVRCIYSKRYKQLHLQIHGIRLYFQARKKEGDLCLR